MRPRRMRPTPTPTPTPMPVVADEERPPESFEDVVALAASLLVLEAPSADRLAANCVGLRTLRSGMTVTVVSTGLQPTSVTVKLEAMYRLFAVPLAQQKAEAGQSSISLVQFPMAVVANETVAAPFVEQITYAWLFGRSVFVQ